MLPHLPCHYHFFSLYIYLHTVEVTSFLFYFLPSLHHCQTSIYTLLQMLNWRVYCGWSEVSAVNEFDSIKVAETSQLCWPPPPPPPPPPRTHPSDICACNQDIEGTRHFLLECLIFATHRESWAVTVTDVLHRNILGTKTKIGGLQGIYRPKPFFPIFPIYTKQIRDSSKNVNIMI